MAGVDGRDSDSHVCALIPILRPKSVCLSFLEQTVKFVPFFNLHHWKQSWGWGGEKWNLPVTDMPRDKYVERCKQRAFDAHGAGGDGGNDQH